MEAGKHFVGDVTGKAAYGRIAFPFPVPPPLDQSEPSQANPERVLAVLKCRIDSSAQACGAIDLLPTVPILDEQSLWEGKQNSPIAIDAGPSRQAPRRKGQIWPQESGLAGGQFVNAVLPRTHPKIAGVVSLDGKQSAAGKPALSREDSCAPEIHATESQPAAVPDDIAVD
jgi:hypothetical protein